jgi:hypothetical protein
MDVDSISLKFRTMNTNDKDSLIADFRRLSKTDLTNEGCCFYLDLAEWNLNTALWAYYEYAAAAAASSAVASLSELPQMRFLCDVTIGEGESVAPNTNFVKKWRILNCGTNKWPHGCQLKYVNGYNFKLSSDDNNNNTTTPTHISDACIRLDRLEPAVSCEISIQLKSPDECQMYQCQMKLFTQYNQPFGDAIWLLLAVEQGGVLGITQQLNDVSVFLNGRGERGGADNNNNNNNNNNHKRVVNHHQNPFASRNSSTTKPPQSSQIDQSETRPDFYDDMFS